MSSSTLPGHRQFPTVAVTGNIDAVTAKLFEQHIMHALAHQPTPLYLVLDLTAAAALTRAGLEVLARAQLRAGQQRTSIILRGAHRQAFARPLQATGLWTRFLIE